MAGCCQVPLSDERAANVCPSSGAKGKAVEIQTVKALLAEPGLRRLNRSSHWFCPDADCDVVYFDGEGQSYTTADIRVPVWQKEPFGSRII